MKSIFSILIILGAQLLSSLALASGLASECTVVKSVSVDEKTRGRIYGNAFAISENEFVINEHSLAPDANIVSLTLPVGNRVSAIVVARDFHTDLALLKIRETANIKPCKLDKIKSATMGLSVEIFGFESDANVPSVIRSDIINRESSRLEVPGVLSSIEIGGSRGGVPMRSSMSGSPVIGQDGVIGVLTQRTPEGTGLIIPSDQVSRVVNHMRAGTLPKRNYEYDARRKVFKFQGLELGAEDGQKLIGGNPHEGDLVSGGNPHEGEIVRQDSIYAKIGNRPIGLHDLDLGYAIARVSNMAMLMKFQPQIGKLLSKASTKTVFIRSIDGIEVRNLFQFVRALGMCTNCVIDNFWIESSNPQELGNKYLQGVGLLSQFLNSLDAKGESSPAFQVLPAISRLNRDLIVLAREIEIYGRVSNQQLAEAEQAMAKFEVEIERMYFSIDQLDLLNELRMTVVK